MGSSVDEIRERYMGSNDMSREAFEELAHRCEQLEQEKFEMSEMARSKMAALKEINSHQRDKLSRLREKYAALLDMYNELAEEAKERSDSSSSSSSDDDDNCSLM